MTQRRALGDHDGLDSAFDDPDDGWFGHVPAGDPVPSRDGADHPGPPPDDLLPDDEASAADTDRWPVPTVDPTQEAPTGRVPPHGDTEDRWPDRAPVFGQPPVAASWESRVYRSGAWDFKASTPQPWYRSKAAVMVMVAAAVAIAGVALVMPSASQTQDEPTPTAPPASTAQPVPTSSAPALSTPNQPPLPPLPPPPPPPPPPAGQISPPTADRSNPPRRQSPPTNSTPPPSAGPRAPTTRSPFSATPPPPRTPDRDSSAPGDAPARRRGFF